MIPTIRIMHVLHRFDIGGLENGVVNLINRMDERVFSHSICCITRSGTMADRIQRSGVRIHEMNKRPGNDLLLPFRLRRLFQQEDPTIVHTRNWGTVDAILSAKLAGVPYVVHGEHGRDMTDVDGSHRRRNLFRKGLSPFVNQFITVSDDLREWLVQRVRINGPKVKTIINGVDTDTFNDEDKAAVRRKHGLDSRTITIGTVGRLDPVKNQQLLVRAFGKLSQKHDHMKLLIIGDGPCRLELEQLAQEPKLQEKICFLGARQDVPELLKLLDVFVLPSLAEGISNTVLESMATGIPMVATAVGGNPELIEEGVTGRLCPNEDLYGLTKAIESYVVDPAIREAHGAAARIRTLQRFSLESMVATYAGTYASLVRQ